MTRKEYIELANEALKDNAEAVEVGEKMLASLAKKRSTDKPTKKQIEGAAIKEHIAEVLAASAEPMTATDVGLAVGGIDYRRVAALVKQMDNVVKSRDEKGRALYALAAEEAE